MPEQGSTQTPVGMTTMLALERGQVASESLHAWDESQSIAWLAINPAESLGLAEEASMQVAAEQLQIAQAQLRSNAGNAG